MSDLKKKLYSQSNQPRREQENQNISITSHVCRERSCSGTLINEYILLSIHLLFSFNAVIYS